MKHILVTGASGYIGRYLILELLKRGHRVTALLRQPDRQLAALRDWLENLGADSLPLDAIRGDLGQPGAGISPEDWQAIRDCTVLYHCGALFGWNLPAEEARRINVDGSLALMREAASRLRLERFIQVSGYMLTMGAHLQRLGITGNGAGTDWPSVYRATGSYEASKLEAHFALRRLAKTLMVPLTVVHPATVCGHADTGELPANQEMANTLRMLVDGKLAAVPGGCGYRLPLVSADYLTRFMAELPSYPETAGQEYLLADAGTPSLKAVLTQCAHESGIRPPILSVPVPVLKGLATLPVISAKTGVSREQLHFLRQEPLDTGLTERQAQRMGVVKPELAHVLSRTMQVFCPRPAPADRNG